MANYKLDNFIKLPEKGDKRLEIYNKDGITMYSLDPNDTFFFYKDNNIVVQHLRTGIEFADCKNYIYVNLDFSSTSEATTALAKADNYRNILIIYISQESVDIDMLKDYFLSASTTIHTLSGNTATEIDIKIQSAISYIIDTNGYTKTETDNIVYSATTTRHNHLSDVYLGNINPGDTIPTGLTMDNFIELITTKIYNPTFTNPYSTLSHNQTTSVECGSYYNTITLIINLNRGEILGANENNIWIPSKFQNYRSGTVSNYIIDSTSLGFNNTKILSAVTIIEGSNIWLGSASYLSGAQPLNNKGNSYSNPLSSGITSTSITINGYRKLFYGFNSTADSSDAIRALGYEYLNPAKGYTFTMVIPSGTSSVIFAYPSILGSVTSVKYVEMSNSEIKSIFNLDSFGVEGADNYTERDYNVYVYAPVVPYSQAVTYTITI